MSRYPPLTAEELRQLYEQCPTPEARRLLWEIDRLQELVCEAGQFLRAIDQAGLEAENLVPFSTLLSALDAERRMRRKRPSPQPPAKLGSEMAEPFVGPPEAWMVRARRVGERRIKPRRR